MLFRALFRSNVFFGVSQKININQMINSSKTMTEVNKVFNQHHHNFDKIHHLFFLRKSLFFNSIPTNNAIQSIKYLEQNLNQISNDSFCLFVYHTMDSNLNVNVKEFHKQIDKRHKQFTIKNINLLLTSFGRHKNKFENIQSTVQLLTKNINLAKVQQPIDLINLLQNLNESGKTSKSLNKGIIGKLSVLSGWHNLRNINVLLKTILIYNLDQNISFMEKGLEQTISKSYQTKNLIILLHYLSKFNQSNLELVDKILKRVKQLGQYRKKQISDGYLKISETLEQQATQVKLDVTQMKPIKVQNIRPQEFNIIDSINILGSMNRLSLYDNELFQISQQVFFQKLNSISLQNLVLFLNSHRGFCLRLIQKIGIQNKDYNRKVNNVKEYYNNFYLKVFTFLKTKDTFNLVFVYHVLKAAQGMYFTNNDTKQMAINLVYQKSDKNLLKDQQVKQLFQILESYKRLPEKILEIQNKLECNIYKGSEI